MYYTLLVKICNKWTIQFGDFNQWVVREEKKDWRRDGTRYRDMQIIATGDTQQEIDKAVKQLNRLNQLNRS